MSLGLNLSFLGHAGTGHITIGGAVSLGANLMVDLLAPLSHAGASHITIGRAVGFGLNLSFLGHAGAGHIAVGRAVGLSADFVGYWLASLSQAGAGHVTISRAVSLGIEIDRAGDSGRSGENEKDSGELHFNDWEGLDRC